MRGKNKSSKQLTCQCLIDRILSAIGIGLILPLGNVFFSMDEE